MGRVKELWVEKQEEIAQKYLSGELAFPDAIYALVRLGFDPHEAKDLLEMSLA